MSEEQLTDNAEKAMMVGNSGTCVLGSTSIFVHQGRIYEDMYPNIQGWLPEITKTAYGVAVNVSMAYNNVVTSVGEMIQTNMDGLLVTQGDTPENTLALGAFVSAGVTICGVASKMLDLKRDSKNSASPNSP